MTEFEQFCKLMEEFSELMNSHVYNEPKKVLPEETSTPDMKIAFRIECPHCTWGYEWRNDFVNQGWLALTCKHCEQEFFAKVSIPTVSVETKSNQPEAPISGQFNKTHEQT